MKILNFNKFNFINESYSDFNQFQQQGITPSSLGFPGYGFAVDNSLSIYGQKDSPYTDQYYRTPMMVNSLLGVIKSVYRDVVSNYGNVKYDQFLEEVDEFADLKVLRINVNANQNIDVYISFFFGEEEFFGVFKNFNWINREQLKSDLFTDNRYRYIDKEYRLKLDNYLRKILEKWFRPQKGWYLCLNDQKIPCKGKMGNKFLLPKNTKVQVKYADDESGNAYIQFIYKGEPYIIDKNNYYYWNYWFEKTDEPQL